ncbi:MAG TPA: 4Fe-4S dicluster-binding protein [Sumerlaeia bacterium]|nr:4Fe-4S dicluster-binding protein [Sumerlaeia bacterium]
MEGKEHLVIETAGSAKPVGGEDDGLAQPDRRPSAVIHAEQCKGCGRCIEGCPEQVLECSDRRNSQGFVVVRPVSPEKCTGCGLCFYTCPEPGAITVYRKVKGNGDPVCAGN